MFVNAWFGAMVLILNDKKQVHVSWVDLQPIALWASQSLSLFLSLSLSVSLTHTHTKQQNTEQSFADNPSK
jgi:hypothetical protein